MKITTLSGRIDKAAYIMVQGIKQEVMYVPLIFYISSSGECLAWTMPAAAKRSSCGRMGRAAARAQTPGKVARVAKDKNWKRVSEKL